MERHNSNGVHRNASIRWDSVRTLADELRVSDKTIRRQIDRGRLVAHHIGREIRISPDSKQKFIDSILLPPGGVA